MSEPYCFSLYYNKGVNLYKLGKYELTLEAFDKAIELNPKDSEVYYGKGLVFSNLGKYDLALEVFNKVLELNPSNFKAQNNKLLLLEKMKGL